MLEIRILGPLEVSRNDRPVDLGGAKQRALLAALVLHRREAVSSDRLIDELWGERPPATAAKALQVYVSHLRNALGADLLLTRGPGYLLAAQPDQVDLDRFEALVDRGREAIGAGDAESAAERFRDALALWRGRQPLADFAYEPFAQAEIARMEEDRLAALEERIDADLALGRHGQLVGELEALVREHPLRESLRSHLMLALYRSGRHADALAVYRSGRQALVDEFGVEPGRALCELHQAILEQNPSLDLPGGMSAPALVEASPSPVFVGRERELSELTGAFEDASAGRGRLFILIGEPGIGKSRLAEEVAARARARGAHVLVGRCWEAGGAPAYWPWVQSLRSYLRETDSDELIADLGSEATAMGPMLPELYELIDGPAPGDLDSDGARFRLFAATAAFLRGASEARPIVLLLDDLHAADTPSLLLLRFLARQLGSMHVLLLAALRDVDPLPGEPLTAMLADVAREPVTRRASLTGLGAQDVARYLDLTASEIASTELSAALHAETEGNPLFVAETVRLLSLEGIRPERGAAPFAIPQTVRDVISRRLAHLSTECNRMLVLASVLGREFTLDGLTHFSGASEDDLLDAIDEAMVARVFAEVPGVLGRLRFAHVLIRDTLYDALTTPHRVRLHRRALEALESLHKDEPGPHLAELAHHAIAGRDFEKGRGYASRAGDRALSLLAFEEAERLYMAALEALELASDRDGRARCELLLSLGEARARAGDSARAQATFLEAAELARRLGLGRELARAAVGYGGRIVWARAGKDARLVPLLESGLAALPEEEVELRVRLLARLAGALRDEPSMERREAMSREAVELARRSGDPSVLAYAVDGLGSIIGGRPGTDEEQNGLATELLLLAERAGDRERVVSAHYQRFIAAIGVGDVVNAEAALSAAATAAEELRQPVQLWQVRAARAMLALAAGSLAEAEELIEEALALGERAQRGMAIPTHTLHCHTLRDFQGRLGEVEPALRAAAAEHASQPVYRCALTHLQCWLSQTADARGALDELAADDFKGLPEDNEWLHATTLLAEACWLLGDAEKSRVLYGILRPFSQYNAVDTPDAVRGSVSRYLGLLAATLECWTQAAAHFEDALSTNARMGFKPWLARTQHDYGYTLLNRDRPAGRKRALALIGDAVTTYRELGMNAWAATASELRRSPRPGAITRNQVTAAGDL